MVEYDLSKFGERNLEKNDDNNLIYVSSELAEVLQDARTHKGLTQNDLANEVEKLSLRLNEKDNCTTGLDISRIETQKKRRIKLGKIKLIEMALDLREGTLSELSTRGDYENKIRVVNESMYTGGASVNERAGSPAAGQPMKINFCYNCGFKLNKPGMNFCPCCGEDLRS